MNIEPVWIDGVKGGNHCSLLFDGPCGQGNAPAGLSVRGPADGGGHCEQAYGCRC